MINAIPKNQLKEFNVKIFFIKLVDYNLKRMTVWLMERFSNFYAWIINKQPLVTQPLTLKKR